MEHGFGKKNFKMLLEETSDGTPFYVIVDASDGTFIALSNTREGVAMVLQSIGHPDTTKPRLAVAMVHLTLLPNTEAEADEMLATLKAARRKERAKVMADSADDLMEAIGAANDFLKRSTGGASK